jgi:hypothetical protein
MQPTPSEKSLESIFKYFSLAYVLLITAGLLYNIFFYRNYGITITEYIDLSEALVLFMPMLTNFFTAAFLIITPFFMLARKGYYQNLADPDPRMNHEAKGFRKFVFLSLGVSLLIALIFYIVSFFDPKVGNKLRLLLIFIFMIFGSSVIDFILDWTKKENIISLSPTTRDIIPILIIFLTFIY